MVGSPTLKPSHSVFSVLASIRVETVRNIGNTVVREGARYSSCKPMAGSSASKEPITNKKQIVLRKPWIFSDSYVNLSSFLWIRFNEKLDTNLKIGNR